MAKAKRSRLIINENTKAFIMQVPDYVIKPITEVFMAVNKAHGRRTSPDEFIVMLDRYLRKLGVFSENQKFTIKFSEWQQFCENNIHTGCH